MGPRQDATELELEQPCGHGTHKSHSDRGCGALSNVDERKRVRDILPGSEAVLEARKEKRQLQTFEFQCFDVPLREIEVSCGAAPHRSKGEVSSVEPADIIAGSSPLDRKDGLLSIAPQICSIARTGIPSAANVVPAAFPACAVTPYAQQPLQFPGFQVATLHAQDAPLSPFEFGGPPNGPMPRPYKTFTRLSDGATTQCTSSPGASPSLDTSRVGGRCELPRLGDSETSLRGSFRRVDELAGQFAIMQDAVSQGASQESSLADTKVLKSCSMSFSASEGKATAFSRNFTYVAVIGETKTCTVYLATAQDQQYAIKEIKRMFTSKADREELIRELRTVSCIPSHPNVVKYIKGWQEHRKLHIQMMLCEGGSLDVLLKRGALLNDQQCVSEQLLWKIFSDTAQGLSHIHKHGVLHLDIKPENIYLDGAGNFRIGDFGLAVMTTAVQGWEEGDGRFLAPELLQHRSVPSQAADVFSLGMSLLHCITGTEFNVHDTAVLAAEMQKRQLSHSMQHLLASMVVTDPAARPRTDQLCEAVAANIRMWNTQECCAWLAETAHKVHQYNLSEQRRLHCSPSIGTVHSLDGLAFSGWLTEDAASHPSTGPVPVRDSQARQAPLSASPTHAKLQRNSRGPNPALRSCGSLRRECGGSAGAAPATGFTGARLSFAGRHVHSRPPGTPPSVVPNPGRYASDQSPLLSMGSLRVGPLSFGSIGRGSGSVNLTMDVPIENAGTSSDLTSLGEPRSPMLGQLVASQVLPGGGVGTNAKQPEGCQAGGGGRGAAGHATRTTAALAGDLADPDTGWKDGKENTPGPDLPSTRVDTLNRYFRSQGSGVLPAADELDEKASGSAAAAPAEPPGGHCVNNRLLRPLSSAGKDTGAERRSRAADDVARGERARWGGGCHPAVHLRVSCPQEQRPELGGRGGMRAVCEKGTKGRNMVRRVLGKGAVEALAGARALGATRPGVNAGVSDAGPCGEKLGAEHAAGRCGGYKGAKAASRGARIACVASGGISLRQRPITRACEAQRRIGYRGRARSGQRNVMPVATGEMGHGKGTPLKSKDVLSVMAAAAGRPDLKGRRAQRTQVCT